MWSNWRREQQCYVAWRTYYFCSPLSTVVCELCWSQPALIALHSYVSGHFPPQQIPLNCPANYEKISCDTCQCKAAPDEPCPDGGSWDPSRCECIGHPVMPENMPEAMLPIVCQRTCPLGTTIRQDCECYTDDCMSLSARDCEGVKCGTDSYCGLGSKTSSSAPE